MTPLKKTEKQHASELWSILVLLVGLAYLKESVENAFLVVLFIRKKNVIFNQA